MYCGHYCLPKYCILSSKDIHVQTLATDDYMLPYMAKRTSLMWLRILRCRDHYGLSSEPNCNLKYPYKGKTEAGELDWVWTVGDVPMEVRGWSDARKRPFIWQEMQTASRSWKKKGGGRTEGPLRASGRNQPCLQPDVSPVKSILDFWLPKCFSMF